jgi:undecaprenyl-diphosphatase
MGLRLVAHTPSEAAADAKTAGTKWGRYVSASGWLLAACCSAAHAGGGLLGLDHELGYEASGVWSRRNQLTLQFGVVALEVGGALWLGDTEPFGHTLWQTVDASTFSSVGAAGLKRVFGRARPVANQGPDAWFRGRCCQSFPSGEVTLQASFVTPIILNHAEHDPWVWLLEALPVYDAVARMKSRAHWPSDVLAGWALGTAAGYWATQRKTPFFVEVLPRRASVGYATRF